MARAPLNPSIMRTAISRFLASATATGALLALIGCTTPSRYERSGGEFLDDKMLGNRVKHALNAQPVYKYPDVKVNTFRGVVQLSGFVAAEPQRAAATEIAERVRGVVEIQNDILVAPLDQELVRDYIPGREDNDAARERTGSTGAPSSGSRTNIGSTTNGVVR